MATNARQQKLLATLAAILDSMTVDGVEKARTRLVEKFPDDEDRIVEKIDAYLALRRVVEKNVDEHHRRRI